MSPPRERPAGSHDDPYRLPGDVIPQHYDLRMQPDLEAATFRGTVAIRLQVQAPTQQIVLNARELDLDAASLAGPAEEIVALDEVRLEPDTERLVVLSRTVLAPGTYTLTLDFRGALNAKLAGFYRSTYRDDADRERVIATTQFEATDARRAFPCFDEPALKATFGITLEIDRELFAVSNAPVDREEDLGDGRKRLQFAPTMKMSTYLVAFVIGPFEASPAVDVDGVPLRVVHAPGKGHLAGYALRAGAHALRYFREYYGIPYPGTKLDMVAIPDFAFGAMENLGCITYRELLLLVDETRATEAELLRCADVICHEIAHMWFGDLVTMEWWNGIWLNEAFATFMATKCCDAFEPRWNRWDQFSRERSGAFDVDALASTRTIEYPVASPADADGMFDVLTYVKGASVLRMLEQYLGEDCFRAGVRHYLEQHSYGNTRTRDLWDALEARSDQPVRRIMDSWILQRGFPCVTLEQGADGALLLSQERFRYLEGAGETPCLWSVPVTLRFSQGAETPERRLLLEDARAELPPSTEDTSTPWVLANAGAHGFYRVRYGADLRAALARQLMTCTSAAERYALLDDAWAAVLAGRTSSADFLTFGEQFAAETDLDVWALLGNCFGNLERLVAGQALAALRTRVCSLAGPALASLGWEPQVQEPPRTRELRGLLIRLLAARGRDPDALAEARRRFDAQEGEAPPREPNVAAACAAAVAAEGTATDYERFLARIAAATTPQEERRFRFLLAEFPGGREMARTLASSLDGAVRTQDAPYLLGACLGNREHGGMAWEFIARNWSRLLDRFPDNTIVRMLAGLPALSQPRQAAAVIDFFGSHQVPSGELTLRQHLDKLQVNLALRQREAEPLAAHLTHAFPG